MTKTEADIAVIKEHMKNTSDDVHEILDALKGTDSKPGLILDVDRLKQNDARRTWLIRTLVAAIGALGLQALFSQLGWF